MSLAMEEAIYTYADYKAWSEDERIEIIDGTPVMQASPSTAHQNTVLGLGAEFHNFLKGKPCNVYLAPLSVRLEVQTDDSDTTVLEPDIFVVCDPNKMKKDGCVGAPDLVIEVLSPSTAKLDRIVKFRKYLNAGVREYWIVDPDIQSVHVNILANGAYVGSVYEGDETVPVQVLPGCSIDLREIFVADSNENEKTAGQ